jgi:hypothetical protein
MQRLPSHRALNVALFGFLLASLSLLSIGSAQASTLPKLSLTINAKSITASGALQSGAVNVVTTNTGKKEASAILFALKPGVTAAEVEGFLKSKKGDPNAASKYGAIVFDAEANPGKPSEVQTKLAPGEYLALLGRG